MHGLKKAIAGSGLLIGGALLASLITQGLPTTSLWFMFSNEGFLKVLGNIGLLGSLVLIMSFILIFAGICLIYNSLFTND